MANHHPFAHPPYTIITSYLLGNCSQIERETVEKHLIDCDECRLEFAVLLRVLHAPVNIEEQRELEQFLPMGLEAFTRARLQCQTNQAGQPDQSGQPTLSARPDQEDTEDLTNLTNI